MGYAFICRNGTVASKKEKVLLKSNISISLRAEVRNDPQYYNINLNESLDKYSKIEIQLNGSLESNGGYSGDYTSTLSLSIQGGVNVYRISTVKEYGPGRKGSEDISGIYTLTIPAETSNIIQFYLSSLYYVTQSFSGTVTVYGIPK